MIKRIKHYLNELGSIKFRLTNLSDQVHEIKSIVSNDLKSPKVNLGQIQSYLNSQKTSVDDLSEVEFQVFSQFGDDGIIQYLVSKIDIPNKTFIEFGVENYTESNTRFLLINNNWTGYVIDGSEDNVSYIKNDIVSWACELHVEAAFINAENINELLSKPGFDEEIGILSIDIDGNDYWVWKAISVIRPVIVIVEYNSLFGKNTSWSVPYDPSFVRQDKHASILYFGASIKALTALGEQKGYAFIGCNSKGNNAYFVRNDKLGNIKRKTAEEGYVLSKFRETMKDGKRVSGLDRIKLIEGLSVTDTLSSTTTKISSGLIEY